VRAASGETVRRSGAEAKNTIPCAKPRQNFAVSGAPAGRRARFALLFYIFDGFSAKFFAKKKDFFLFRRIY